MAEKINYGESEAVLAQRGVSAYNTAAQSNIANVKAQLDEVAAQLAAGIQVGMTPEETAALNARLNNLKNQAQTLTGQTQASYDFATKQSQTSNQEYNQQILAMQEAQRRATGQTINQLQAVPTPGGYSSTIAESEENIRRQAAAEQAFMTGRGSVPADMQRITPGLLPSSIGTQGGVIGVSGGTQQLFQSALSSAQQSALANLRTSQLRLQQELESEARTAASDRETKQREKYEDFKIAAVNSIVTLTSQIGTKRAELEAAAASADTRTGKQIANAELDKFNKQAAIGLKNDLARIRAQARSAGFSQDQVDKADQATKIGVGADTKVGQFVQNRIQTIGTTPRIGTFIDPKTKKPREGIVPPGNTGYVTFNGKDRFTTNGKDALLIDGSGFLFYNQNADDTKSKSELIDFNNLYAIISYGLGSAYGISNKAQRDKVLQTWYGDPNSGLGTPAYRAAAAVVLGAKANTLDFWIKSFDKTGTPTLGPKSNPFAGNIPTTFKEQPVEKVTPVGLVKQGLKNTFLPFVKQQMFPQIR